MGQSPSSPTLDADWGSGDGAKYRNLAQEQYQYQRQASEESQAAYKSGQGARARALSEKSKAYRAQAEQYNEMAASAIFAHHNPRYSAGDGRLAGFLGSSSGSSDRLAKIDLHGLFVKEALQRVEAHLIACRTSGIKRTLIITGRGSHSDGGIAKIRPQVENLLLKEKVTIVGGNKNRGVFEVELLPSSTPVSIIQWLLRAIFGR